MERDEHLAALRRDGVAFAEICAATPWDAAVPSCPGWSVADLVWHLTGAQAFWASIVEHPTTEPDIGPPRARPPGEELVAAYHEGFDHLVEVLADADPATTVWTWIGTRGVGFVHRRMAHETAVHLWDAEYAGGTPQPVEAVLASDGIDELLYVVRPADGSQSLGGTVHLHCTDVAGEWLIVPGVGEGDGYTVTREHAKGSCALRGTASDLLLVLWGRLPIERIDVVGDAGVAVRFVGGSSTG